MGNIQQALERARLRNEAKREKRVFTEPSDTHLQRRTGSPRTQDSGDFGLDLRYPLEEQVSQSISLNMEHLIANRVILGRPSVAAVSSYKMLRTRLLQQLLKQEWNSIGITSTIQGEGKSLTALNLAISLATDSNHEVVLVDLDFRNPSIHKLLGISPEIALSDYIENPELNVKHILFGVDQRPRLFVIPNKNTFEHSAETLSAARVTRMFRALCEPSASRIVICDLPPLVVDDAIAFAPNIDSLLLVICEGKAKRNEVAMALDLLPDQKLIGSVLNRSDEVNLAYY